jgi:hypothetical protein
MIKVLYGGYLRPFKHIGHHPQFEHIRYPRRVMNLLLADILG